MSTDRFENKYPEELLVLTFDFSEELAVGETLAAPTTATVEVLQGTDPSPATLLNGSPAISGGSVLLPIDTGLPGVDYRIKIITATSNPNKVLACIGKLYVEA